MEKVELLKRYFKQANESDRALIECAIESYESGNRPELPLHIKNSLLLKSPVLLTPETDFEALQSKLQQAELQAKYDAIAEHIYLQYSELKQAQDAKWVDSYTTKLKAIGVENLEAQIVSMTSEFLSGESLEECVGDIENAIQKEMYIKLIKVAIRTQWAEDCITEGKAAIAEDREPKYPEYPL